MTQSLEAKVIYYAGRAARNIFHGGLFLLELKMLRIAYEKRYYERY